MKRKIALQLFSVRDFAEQDLKGTLAKVKAMGYDGVEFAGGVYGNDPLQVKAWCEELGLVPISGHLSAKLLRERKDLIDAYATIGCRYLAMSSPDYEMMPWTDRAEEFYAFLREIGQLAKEKGMQFCFHNHDADLRPMGDTTALDLIYDNVDADLLQTELDLCWVYSAGIDPVIYINRYKDRSRIIHCKDSNGRFREVYYKWHGGDFEQIKKTQGEMEFRPVGHGMLSYPAIMKAIDNTDIEWLIVEQDRPNGGMTSLECAQKSVEYLKSF